MGFATGAPPTLTDDTGTPGACHGEADVGIGYMDRPGVQAMDLPCAELRYGLGERGQLTCGISYLTAKDTGCWGVSGLGITVIGGKWRFYGAGENGLLVSMHPQVAFNTAGSHADRRGLVEDGVAFVWSLQFPHAAGPVTAFGEIGREFNPCDDAWCYGAAVVYRYTEKIAPAVELGGGCSVRASRSQLSANFSMALDLSENTSLLLAIARELHNQDECRASLVGFVGVQWRH